MEQRLTSVYHLQAKGLVDRLHCMLKAALRAHISFFSWWDELPWVLLALRTSPILDIGYFPADLVFHHAPLLGELVLHLPALPQLLTMMHHHRKPENVSRSTLRNSYDFVFFCMSFIQVTLQGTFLHCVMTLKKTFVINIY